MDIEATKQYGGGHLFHGDCLEILPSIPAKSIDMILCDLPYGTTTRNKWDSVIPLDQLWEQYNRIIKDNGAICLFAQQPFATDLINSARKLFRYEWVWNKKVPVGFLNCNRMPLRLHELVLVFYKKLPTYNPQFTEGKPYSARKKQRADTSNYGHFDVNYPCLDNDGKRYPVDIVECPSARTGQHPTQKPVDLCEYLIKTYTNEGETVLDNCLGSGTTAVACLNTDRRFIGIEKDEKFFKISEDRIIQAINDKQAEENQV